jgi:hypothetical protein
MRRPWSEKEIQLLKQLYPHLRTKEVAERLGRPQWEVFQKAFQIGVKKGDIHYWSPKQVKLLRKLFADRKMDTGKMSDILGRSPQAIRMKAWMIGLNRPKRGRTRVGRRPGTGFRQLLRSAGRVGAAGRRSG